MKKITINPVTRISGFMEIETYLENNIVVDAKTEGLLFRGFEKMLVGRPPLDAVYFTERICGICSTAHSIASTMALENALGIVPSEQGRYLRDFVHGCEFLQNHIRHFYQYTVPDFIKLPEVSPLFEGNGTDYRLSKDKNDLIAGHYFDSLEISRSAHEMLAILGGKVPHNHGVFVGGISTQATTDKIIKMKSILSQISHFISSAMIPDVYEIARYYGEYYSIGMGYGNLLSYGCFNNYKDIGTLYVNPMVYVNGKFAPFDPKGVTERSDYAWYRDNPEEGHHYVKPQEEDFGKANAYSWVKAPRYFGVPCEGGPLARMWLSGNYKKGISTMDRTIARVLEAKKLTEILDTLLKNLIPGTSVQSEYTIPEHSGGAGLIDTTRGALAHWLEISDGRILTYNIITPSAWNLSTMTPNGLKGTAERALIGTQIKDTENPFELGRIIRSFDPCVSCATHVYSFGKHKKTITVVP